MLTGHFAAGSKGPIFVLVHVPAAPTGRAVLVVPPFAEEMNKVRRTVTEVARELAARGIATVVPDFYGTGDSAGEFADADLDAWCADLRAVIAWCDTQALALTGVIAPRLGGAFAQLASAAQVLPAVSRTVLWQPAFDGERALTQFLRIRVAAALMDQDRRESVAQLRERLRAGETVEVAGYALTEALVSGIEKLRWSGALSPRLGRVSWFNIVADAAQADTDPAQRLIAQARSKGIEVDGAFIVGAPFWTSTETVVVRELVTATANVLAAA